MAQATKNEQPEKEERTDQHRIAGLALAPVLTRLGYATEVEVDVSFQRQLIDVIAVRRVQILQPTLPSQYWQVFDDLNEHNLLSFKSYSESFNGQALEEFYGHLTNYCKVKKVARPLVNLYVLTNHYPQDLLEPLQAAGLVKEVRPGEVYDLTLSTLKRVRFIVCSRTDNPVLALFSNNVARVQAAYQTLQGEPQLFGEVSLYWQRIVTRLDKEIKNMYTKEDFLRDYPPTSDGPVLFAWQVEELLKQTKAQQVEGVFERGVEQGIEQGEAAMRQTLVHILQRRLGEVPASVHEHLHARTLAELNALVNPALDATTWDEFMAALPKSTT